MGKHIRSTSEFISIGGKQVTQKLKSSTSPSIWGVLLAGAPECDEPPSPKSPGLAHMKDRRHADTAHPGLPNTSIRSSLTLLYLPTLAPLPIPYESPLDWAKNKPIHHYHHSALSPAFFAAEYRPPTNPSRNANSREPLIPSNQALNLALTKASKEANWKKEKKTSAPVPELCQSCDAQEAGIAAGEHPRSTWLHSPPAFWPKLSSSLSLSWLLERRRGGGARDLAAPPSPQFLPQNAPAKSLQVLFLSRALSDVELCLVPLPLLFSFVELEWRWRRSTNFVAPKAWGRTPERA